ncbi:MAG TPA: hypothetical protein VFL84_02690 [Gammaproteobacteria bacterium]|nr:hypothetical protein [Gammaproteobacteria bacterium]
MMIATAAPLRLVGRLCGVVLLGIAAGIFIFRSALAQEPQPEPPDSPPDSAAAPAEGGVRARTRLVRRSATAVTDEQASELTLTLTVVSFRPIQTWVRTAGVLDAAGKVLTAQLRSPEAELVEVGQRVRTFSVNTRTQMVQAKITRVTPRPGGATVEATLAAAVANDGARHLMEIVTEKGPLLSVPNESIIEEAYAQVVYLKLPSGEFAPRTIETGITGELYTEIVDGLEDGDEVVSIGSFFVDADNKLKGGPAEP